MTDTPPHGPWNPGIQSPVPRALRHLCTIFRPESSFTSYEEAHELRGFTGLDYVDLVDFRPERLALHELLIRVSTDLTVPDGDRIEDLGINFRAIVREVLADFVEPRLADVAATYASCREKLSSIVRAELESAFRSAQPHEAISKWEATAHGTSDAASRAAARALAKTVSAVIAKHGMLWGTPELLASIAMTLALNDYGAEEIGRALDPWLADARSERGLRVLPTQERPVVMNTKGASASGKSTLRPLQRRLAGEIGTDWRDFALISPDIWRKQLLDYASLGQHYKYAGAFTGDELQVIDRKLDQYMARKANRGGMSHLLIDRFRFDSFAPDSDVAGSNLLTRFGRVVYLFFMITPPASLVERAWNRGLDVGRYKAVDDTLAHGVEAYSGMPELFFTWIARTDKRVHFEFLDNTVPLGEPPRTVAFGWNDSMTIFDVECLLDVERYRRVDVNARSPDKLFGDVAALAPQNNLGFLCECVARFRDVSFADAASGRVYLRLVEGKVVAADAQRLLDAERVHTLGCWR